MELQTNVKSGEVKITESGITTEQKPIQVTTEKKPEPDLITRVSQVKEEEIKSGIEIKEPEFNVNDIEKIKDPEAKKYTESAYKSFQRGFNQKFQDIAELRKNLEKQLQDNTKWSPERIQKLLNDPNFVNAAQTVAAKQAPTNFEGTQDDWSNLSDPEKAKFKQLEDKINLLEQQNSQVRKVSEDETLKTRYANFKPEAIDILTADLLAGKVQATREHLWKVYDYENAVKRAYELGRKDSSSNLTDRVNANSIEGITITNNEEKPMPEKGETDTAFFKRIALKNLLKSREQSIRK